MSLRHLFLLSLTLIPSSGNAQGNSAETAQLKKVISIQQNYIKSLEQSIVPDGAISAFFAAKCPQYWVAADGTNGTPDLRGMFVRGMNDFGTGPRLDGSQDPEAGRSLGSFQADANKFHDHGMSMAGQHSHGMDSAGNHKHTLDAAGKHTHGMDGAGNHHHSGTTGHGNRTAYRLVATTGYDTFGNHTSGWAGGVHYQDRNDAAYPMQNHTHNFTTNTTGNHTHGIHDAENHNHTMHNAGSHQHAIQVSGNHQHAILESGGQESRPRNVGLIFCIKR